jgi:L-lactate utilization protein LutC
MSDERPTQKYSDLYKKCSRDYYYRHRENILDKKKKQYMEKKATQPIKEKKEPIKNYYMEVYKPRREQEKVEKLKEELKDMSIEEILNNFKLYNKITLSTI